MTEWRDSVLDCGSPLPLFAAIALIAASPASAHDRHANAAMHQDVHVLIAKDHVEVTFAIESNEEATMLEAIAIDANADGKLSPEEQSVYFAQLDARLREGLRVSLNEKEVALRPSSGVELSPPARKVFHFHGDLDPDTGFPAGIMVCNDNFLDRPGRASLQVECGHGLVIALNRRSSTDFVGAIRLTSQLASMPTRESAHQVDWSAWSWKRRIFTPLIMTAVALGFTVISSIIMLAHPRSPSGRAVAAVLVIAGLAAAGVAFSTRGAATVAPQAWPRQFRSFHHCLGGYLVAYHRTGDAGLLAGLVSQDSLAKLIGATRVVSAGDDKSGAFEVHRLRTLEIVVLEEPRHPLSSILRVRHTWRVIGVMRHDGHPHERIRDFSCDYTLRVTGNGFQLLDCSDWHQLPDEPLE